MRAVLFSIYHCGFFPKSALEEDNGIDNRLEKILRMIEDCKYGVHDISRVQLNVAGLPRFNMPFELGLFMGARRFGDARQKQKTAVVFDELSYRYQQFLSDLNGVDPKAHANRPENIIRQNSQLVVDGVRQAYHSVVPDAARPLSTLRIGIA